jgi:Tfp pilus assembly protein PilO
MTAVPVDVPRLIRIATLLFSILSGSLVWLAYQPQIASLETRLDNDQSALRSEEVAFAETPRLRSERERLARRYGTLLGANPEAIFLRELAWNIRRHGVTLQSSAASQDRPVPGLRAPAALLGQTQLSIELRGSYRGLLAAVGELSHGSEIVGVNTPALRRDGDAVVATIPLTIYAPSPELVP